MRAALVVLGAFAPAIVTAHPFDPTNPTLRPIRVEFEVSAPPGVVGQTWSVPFAATYSASGNTGTVVIAPSVYESAIETHALDYLDALVSWSLVPGSASPFRLDIDLTTFEATAQPLTYQISIGTPVQEVGTVTRNLSTTATAGFTFLSQNPGFPFFCVACDLVLGRTYDPTTGTLNAVGSDDLEAPPAFEDVLGFSRAGDLRLSELDAVSVPMLPVAGRLVIAAVLAGLGPVVAGRRRASG
jgi:hypothetical protein